MGTTEVPPLIFKNFWHVRFMQSGLFSDQLGVHRGNLYCVYMNCINICYMQSM
uniref:Uncharacterized protein n=1 Tax=Helianthus annuus TaxID=4232 RepID=A0A251SH31_HELAN